MKEVSEDPKMSVKEVLLQRDQERKEKLKNLKEEKESTPDQIKLFHETFDAHSQKIYDNIKVIENGKADRRDLSDLFSKISKDIQVLHRYLSVSTVFLTNYIVRKSLQTIEEMETKCKTLEEELLPKKKFGFKSRKPKPVTVASLKKNDDVDSCTSKVISLPNITCGFSNKADEVLRLTDQDINKSDVDLRVLENCRVFLSGNPSTIHISNVRKCMIVCGPVSTSVFIENCEDCDIIVACQQLRIHSTSNTRLYIHVTSRAIIEDTTNVSFAPYNLTYDGLEDHFESSGLDRSRNNWNQVDDFNWLASDAHSPNWREMLEEERVASWPI